MQKTAIAAIEQALDSAHRFAHASNVDGCDALDIDELIESVQHELKQSKPNIQTLSTYINSVARSLRTNDSARKICMQLDAAMRGAGVPSNWESI